MPKDYKEMVDEIINKMDEEEKEVEESSLHIKHQIKALKKAYAPLKGKKIVPGPLMKIFDKIDKNKDTLIQLYKADIPFVSTMAMSRLMLKHNMKAPEINKLREEAPTTSVSAGGVDMAPNAGGPRKMLRRKKENEKDKLAKKMGLMVKENRENNSVLIRSILENIDKIEAKVDEVSGIDNTIKFEEEKPYKTFSDKYKVGK